MLSSICVKQDFTARWLPDILWMAIFYKKAFQFSHVAFKCKSLILAGPIAYFRWPVFKFWLKACLCMNQQILHVWYQSPNFTLELQVHVLFRLLSFQFLTFEIKLLTARLQFIGPLQDPVTWYKISYTGTQMTQWDFQNKGKSGWTGKNSFVLEVPLRHLRLSVTYSVPCDQILQRAYWNSQLWNRSYIYSSYCVTKTVYPWLKGTKWPRI